MTMKCGMVWIVGLLLSTMVGPMKGMAQDAMPGGSDDTSVTNGWVVEAADNAVKLEEKALGVNKDGRPVKLSLVKIMRAQQQNVNVMSFRLKMRVRLDKTEKEVEAVVARKATGEYELTLWEWK